MTKMTHTDGPGKSYNILRISGIDRATKGLTTSTKLCLHLYHFMFIVHDEWQDLITQTPSTGSR